MLIVNIFSIFATNFKTVENFICKNNQCNGKQEVKPPLIIILYKYEL